MGPLRWPEPGVSHSEFECSESFAQHKYTHTNVTHKRKTGQTIQYAAERLVTFPDGSSNMVLGGTQTIDGFWAWLRRIVGRRSANTGKSSDSQKRVWLYQLVRVAKWHYWHLSMNRFNVLGGYQTRLLDYPSFF
jgi:hypothetical protein